MSASTKQSRQLVTRYLEALSGKAKTPDLVAEFVADPALSEHIAQVEAAFPEYELIAEQIVAEGDLVAVRATFRGPERGRFMGIESIGRTATALAMIIYRVADDRIVEHWLQFDVSTLIGQLRDVPAAAGH